MLSWQGIVHDRRVLRGKGKGFGLDVLCICRTLLIYLLFSTSSVLVKTKELTSLFLSERLVSIIIKT